LYWHFDRHVFRWVTTLLLAAAVVPLPAKAASTSNVETAGKVVAFALPVVAVGISLGHHEDWDGVAELGVSTAATLGAAYLLAHVVREQRPDHSDFHSFPSDTAALAYAPADYLWARYGWQYGLPAYAAATFVGFSRVDASGTDHFTRTSCHDALNDAVRNLHSMIEESGAVITREALPWVMGGPIQLTRLFQNLLVNSIKYRSDESPRIHVSAQSRPGEWLFSVKDNGIGIEPQYAEKIFGIFKALQRRDRNSGTGMGLAICRKIVSRHGGRIWVESSLGNGAVFYFTLPRKE